MLDPSSLVLFWIAALALVVVPGPSVLYIVTRGIDQGRAAGIVSVLGIATGSLFHIAAAALGISALLASSALVFDVVKYLGAAYLLYLGARTLLRRDSVLLPGSIRREPLRRIYAHGVVVNVTNPKTALFFFAFLPQFVDVSRGAVALQIVMLGVSFTMMGLVSDSTYALLAARIGAWLRGRLGFARTQRYVTGSIYLGLGAAAALSGSRATAK